MKQAAILSLALILLATTVMGQGGLSLDNVIWSWPNGETNYLCTGTRVIFEFRLSNYTGVDVEALTHGFEIYSPDGASWTSIDVAGSLTRDHGLI